MKQFQQDLRNGMSLEKALQKHNLTLEEAFIRCTNGATTSNNEYHHIYLNKQDSKFAIRKSILGKEQHFGVFDTLEEAVKYRDKLMANGWRKP